MLNSWSPLQFENPANIEIIKKHVKKSSKLPDGLDYMITGVGTGGHITGCAEILNNNTLI
jgi:cysteine synthase A